MLARVAGAVAVVVGLACVGPVLAQDNPPIYPPSLDREPLLAWLQRETDITPDRVVAVTPQAVTSVVSTFPAMPGTGPRVVIRAEALSAETAAQTGALSWHVSLNADCEARRVRLGDATGYAERNLLGERKLLRAGDSNWRPPEKGTALEAAWRYACEAGFKGPFQGEGLKVAKADAPPATTAPAPEPKPVAKPEPAAAPAAPKPKPVAQAPTTTPARGRSGLVVQVGASTSEAEAKGLLKTLGRGREGWVETATVDGKVWRRAVVGGFADGAEATRFCADLKAAGRSCFVRPGKPG